jgi:hypothetical protein
MSPDMPVQLTHQSRIGDTDLFILAIFRRRIEERRCVRVRAGSLQGSREPPWLALNRFIARQEWTRPTHSWIARRQ